MKFFTSKVIILFWYNYHNNYNSFHLVPNIDVILFIIYFVTAYNTDHNPITEIL
jgi:hypothetical protein